MQFLLHLVHEYNHLLCWLLSAQMNHLSQMYLLLKNQKSPMYLHSQKSRTYQMSLYYQNCHSFLKYLKCLTCHAFPMTLKYHEFLNSQMNPKFHLYHDYH